MRRSGNCQLEKRAPPEYQKETMVDSRNTDFPSGLSKPALRALENAGYTRLEQLTRVTEKELRKLHGFGPNALQQLRQGLAEHGLCFASS